MSDELLPPSLEGRASVVSIARGEYPAPPPRPLVPPAAAGVAGLLSVVGVALAPLLPPPFNGLVFVLASIAAALAGLALPQLSIAAGKPLVPLTLVPALGSLAATVASIAGGLSGVPQVIAHLVVLVLSFLAGKALPPATTTAPKEG